MRLTLVHNDLTHQDALIADLIDAGVPSADILAAAKIAGRARVSELIEGFRFALVPMSPAKIGEYFVKEEIAKNPAAAESSEKALLLNEAAARGLTEAEMYTLILAKAAAFRRTALLLASLEAEALADINELSEAPIAIDAAITAVLDATSSTANAAIAAATQVIEGGS